MTKEAIWLRKHLIDLGYQCEEATATMMNNESAIKFAKNLEFHSCTKHIDVRYHFIREKFIDREDVKFISS